MSLFGTQPTGGPGDGLFPPSVDHIVCQNRSGGTRLAGDSMVLDMATSVATSIAPGGNAGTSMWNTLINSTAGAFTNWGYYSCVLEADALNLANVKCTFYGVVNAKVTAGGAAKGNLLTLDSATQGLKLAAAATDRIVGVQLDARDAAGKANVLFDGLTLGGPVA